MLLRSLLAVFFGSVLAIVPLLCVADDAPLTNADIVKMSQSHIADLTVIELIQTRQVAFDVSSDGLVALKKAGVSDSVIKAMVDRTAAQSSAAAPSGSNPASGQTGMPPNMQLPPQLQSMMQSMGVSPPGMQSNTPPTKMPDVWLVNGTQKMPMKPSTATTVQNQMEGVGATGGAGSGMLNGIAQEGLGMALGPLGAIAGGLFGMFSHPKPPPKPHMHLVWALPNPSSQNALQSASPTFELSYADIPGINPDSFEAMIVKLAPTKDNWRLVGASDEELTEQNFMNPTPPSDKIVQDKVDAIVKQTARGNVQLTPVKPLDPGEYGVVLRPDKEADASHDVGGPAQTQLFYTVWDFSVAAAPATAPQPAPAPTSTPH